MSSERETLPNSMISEADYNDMVDRAEVAEADAASEAQWAKHYHDICIALRDALPAVIDCAENVARFSDEIWDSLAMVKAIVRRIDEPTATEDDVKTWAAAEVRIIESVVRNDALRAARIRHCCRDHGAVMLPQTASRSVPPRFEGEKRSSVCPMNPPMLC